MAIAVITGSGGLIGSEAAGHFARQGFDVIGIDNDLRASFFGAEASTAPVSARLAAELGSAFEHLELDIRDRDALEALFARQGTRIELVVHAAAQPSHDWAAREPHTDFAVNATGTLNVLEATRRHCPDASFVFTSTNKVYGDGPNGLPLVELDTRFELAPGHPYADGIPETMGVDRCVHSIFGASKLAADVMVQEYGRYFGMATTCLRGGCLSGAQHAGTELHGFLAYLMRCTVTRTPYTVFGHGARQVRDCIHARDVVAAIDAVHRAPRPGAVYNLGGGRAANVSMLEAIALCERICGTALDWSLSPRPRVGDHRWYVSNLAAFEGDHPGWRVTHTIEDILRDIHDANVERWSARVAA